MKNITIVGIHTEIGKTVTSAILTQALEADYWKPVQSGSIEGTDRQTVKSLVINHKSLFHPESYCFKAPLSPHTASDMEGVEILAKNIILPQTDNRLIMETAGGLLSPLAKNFTNLDLVKKFNFPVILVSRDYLGSINHTLLTYHVLREASIPILGIVFTSEANISGREYILDYTKLTLLADFPFSDKITPEFVTEQANKLDKKLF